MVVKNAKEMEVALFEEFRFYNLCINTLLVQNEAATSTGDISETLKWLKETEETENQSRTNFTSQLLETVKKNGGNDENTSSKSQNTGIKIPVKILSIENPDLIYVKLDDDGQRKSQSSFHVLIQEYYAFNAKTSNDWSINDKCVVFNKNSDAYFRGVIENIEGDNYTVFLCDTGEKITVTSNYVYVLDNNFKACPNMALRCHMAGIKPAGDTNKWSQQAIENLTALVEKQKYFLISKNGETDMVKKSLPITLWYQEVTAGGALEPSKIITHSVNELLIMGGLALKCKNFQESASADNFKDELKKTKGEKELNHCETESFIKRATYENSKSTTPKPKNSKKNAKNRWKNNKKVRSSETESPMKKISSFETDSSAKKVSGSETDSSVKKDSSSETDSSSKTDKTLKKTKSEDNISVMEPVSCSKFSLSTDNTPTFTKKIEGIKNWNELIELELAENETQKPSESEIDDSTSQLSPTFTDWLPPIEFKKTTFSARATFVDHFGNIYLHDMELEPVLKEMENEMKNIFDNCPPESLDTVWKVGQMCTVKYFLNENWYRGKIINAIDGIIKVRMIDYGNEEDCKHDDLRLKVMFPDIPAIASKICLYRVYPKNEWVTSDLDKLHAAVVEKVVTVSLIGNRRKNVVPATVYCDSVNINKFMVEGSTTCVNMKMNEEGEKSDEVEEDDVIILTEQSELSGDEENDKKSMSDENLVSKAFPQISLPTVKDGEKIDAALISVIDYNKVILEFPTETDELLFQEISKDIEENGEKQSVLKDFKVGDACIAKFSQDQIWYRAQIYSLESIDENIVLVWFVDYGNFDFVHVDDVREIKVEWMKYPIQHFIAEIDGIEIKEDRNENDVVKIIDYLSNYIQTMQKTEIVQKNPLKVRIFPEDSNDFLQNQIV